MIVHERRRSIAGDRCGAAGRSARVGTVATVLALGGCAIVSTEPPAEEVTPIAPEVVPATPSPEAVGGMTAELLYDLLLGEIAQQRGHNDVTVSALARAARTSRDPRIAAELTQHALRARNHDQALEAAELWAELAPEETGPHEALARVYLVLGRDDEAYEELTFLLAGEDRARTYRRIADLMSRMTERGGLVELFGRLVALNDDDPDAHYAKAFLAQRFDQPEVAAEAIERALALRPDWEEAAVAMLGALATAGDEESLRAFAEGFLERNPASTRVRDSYARYLVDQGRVDEALAQFDILIENDPENADAIYAAGLLSLQLERRERAEAYLERNLELQPDHDQARMYLGQSAAQRGDHAAAERWYHEVSSTGLRFEAQVMVGITRAQGGDVDGGLDHLLGLSPVDQRQKVRWYLGQEQVLREAKRLPDAKTMLDGALRDLPEDPDLLYARGLVAAQLNLVELHEQDLRKLIAKEPENAHALNALGYTLADQTDRYEEALGLIAKALELRPEDPFILDSMGWVQYRLGKHEIAIDFLQRALSTRQDAEIAAHLGEVLWVSGDREAAESIWNEALERSPDNDVLKDTIRKLRQ